KLQKEIILLKSEIEKEYALDNIVSVSPSMNQIRRIIKAASLADETVLITGESGTGKELVARAIHHNSQRQNFPMVAVDCGALSESLLESELFGHVKGAFTGAVADRKGLFEEADGGTIFLDEISNTSLPLQARLLRVLQEREIRRIGDTKSRPVNVRVIAASNRDLVEECKTERFRSDLFYRLNVLPIALPPLRDRRDDIPLLINYFINEYNKKSAKSIVSISREAMDHLSSLEWKGNIRELKNIIHRMMVFAEGSHLEMGDIPDELLKVKRSAVVPVLPEGSTVFGVSALLPIEDMEREYIRFVLHQTGENKAEASKLLGMKRTTLVMRMKKLGLLA
ncbi:MAG TPA: sigma-54 dependent transcriptional regulator, partial [bacterium]|nr:sigma-54 dependent transcriptional regulator [bacterium]